MVMIKTLSRNMMQNKKEIFNNIEKKKLFFIEEKK